ncbi:phosphatase PAP2 family protein [Dactylosporangium aurantiacum]|uniref:phosphatase PAP2 family protein n=1 Tax=Dactylosporangium aurantiacum TaxID=35754 RepID=UPI000A92778C|nr:phosphatase PAP2 family protein [Dactylosporangium aurantiacum]MDG6109890.1 phosphatase PAP2 family protein [Dactylosporangium aurantiacum]
MDRDRRRLGALFEVAGLLLWLVVFTRLHDAMGKDVAAATADARAVQAAERALHLDVELAANRWLTDHPALVDPAVYLYRLYYVAVAGVLLWLLVRHAEVYRHARRALVAMTVLILPVYFAAPMSPPRFALPGVVDVVAVHDIVERGTGGNQYSAMPSLHVGWALWCAYAAWRALRPARPRLAPLPWLFPALMAADVLGTGNHYVLDIAGSVALVAAAVGVATLWDRARPGG